MTELRNQQYLNLNYETGSLWVARRLRVGVDRRVRTPEFLGVLMIVQVPQGKALDLPIPAVSLAAGTSVVDAVHGAQLFSLNIQLA